MSRKFFVVWLLVGCLLIAKAGFSQRATSFRINEVLVVNTEDYQDDFGMKHAWVELFNSSYASADLGGCYLTNDINNPKLYPIPKGDVLTAIKPRQHVVFWIDNKPTRGTFHVNFAFDPDKENFIALFDSNGRTLIDSMTIPVLAPNQSYGLPEDGVRWGKVTGANGKRANVDLAQVLDKTTPSTNNLLKEQNAANDRFLKNDRLGLGMSIVAISAVFAALIILYLVFRAVGRSHIKKSKMNALNTQGVPAKSTSSAPGDVSAEVYVAIATALYMYNQDHGIHDYESNILTMETVSRRYSPWSSKIYTLRQTPTINKR